MLYILNCFKMGSSDVICNYVASCVALRSRKSNVWYIWLLHCLYHVRRSQIVSSTFLYQAAEISYEVSFVTWRGGHLEAWLKVWENVNNLHWNTRTASLINCNSEFCFCLKFKQLLLLTLLTCFCKHFQHCQCVINPSSKELSYWKHVGYYGMNHQGNKQ